MGRINVDYNVYARRQREDKKKESVYTEDEGEWRKKEEGNFD